MRRKSHKVKKRSGILWRMHKQYGGISLPIVLVLIAVGLIFLLQVKGGSSPYTPERVNGGNQFCSPEPITDSSPSIERPAYVTGCDGDECKSIVILDGTQTNKAAYGADPVIHTYKRIKSNVPIQGRWFHGLSCSPEVEDAGGNIGNEECEVIAPDIKDVQHFKPYGGEFTHTDGKNYEVRYPNAEAENAMKGFLGPNGIKVPAGRYKFNEFGLIFLVHMKEPRKYQSFLTGFRDFVDLRWKQKKGDGEIENGYDRFWIVDIYKDVTKGDRFEKKELPNDILQCQDDPDIALTPPIVQVTTTPVMTNPPQNITPGAKSLQLQYFLFGNSQSGSFNVISWYSPECKPAIYLYPEQDTNVHVSVYPKGFLTYTDPLYPKGGWDVLAHPDGTLTHEGKKYPYLYYESKIYDAYIQKPEKGYVVSFDRLGSLYQSILPRLGLNARETREFIEYWKKTLPVSPYYFVGIMSDEAIDRIEPLQISPKPERIIRVRVYFEALDTFKFVQAPVIRTKERSGFTVAEWGGMVKLHPGEEFTCSQ